MGYVITTTDGELYHYGVKGMRWGHRKDPRVAAAKERYKTAVKYERKGERLQNKWLGIQSRNEANKYKRNRKKAIADAANSKAAYKKALAKAKGKSQTKIDKAEFNAYRSAMQKSGIRESLADIRSNKRSTYIYSEIKKKKGKAYADRVEKSVQNRAYARIAGSTAVVLGAYATSTYLNNKH